MSKHDETKPPPGFGTPYVYSVAENGYATAACKRKARAVATGSSEKAALKAAIREAWRMYHEERASEIPDDILDELARAHAFAKERLGSSAWVGVTFERDSQGPCGHWAVGVCGVNPSARIELGHGATVGAALKNAEKRG